jgi:hypothetical protein
MFEPARAILLTGSRTALYNSSKSIPNLLAFALITPTPTLWRGGEQMRGPREALRKRPGIPVSLERRRLAGLSRAVPPLALKAVEMVGYVGYTWHCSRHTFASRLVMARIGLRTVAERLGHRTLQMVMRYSHLAPEHQASAVDRLVSAGNERDTKTDPGNKIGSSVSRKLL